MKFSLPEAVLKSPFWMKLDLLNAIQRHMGS